MAKGSRSVFSGGLRSLSAWNMMTGCGYLMAKECHQMADSPNCELGNGRRQ